MKNASVLNRFAQIRNHYSSIMVLGCLGLLGAALGCQQPAGNGAVGQRGIFDFRSQARAERINGSTPQMAFNSNQDVQRLNQKLGAYDDDNQMLNTEVAGLKQRLQVANQFNQTLREQLADTSGRIQQIEMERQAAVEQLASVRKQVNQDKLQPASTVGQFASFGGGENPAQFSGGATIRANNSLMKQLAKVDLPGSRVRMDGDLVRIEFSSDRIFVPGTYQIQPSQLPVMQNLVSAIRLNFPKQVVGIEAHWDGTPLNPQSTTHQQLTATQALSVFNDLVRLGVPKEQMFTMAMASNRPRYSASATEGVNPNRRIELVIYPERFDVKY